ncbi:DUF5011 domain-containing protein [Romboutsia weinsteinii]|uniref:DUF5011 domain-containing protein n=1 Tax=Romboutsia weinsteinii TaxID=2020949 RepID=A0A371J210_9FIRM|nr:NPCBM/NEW2 domain-containing protein [Romboutsia weinsteinii]RDY26734.1 DUF5011 domain-containing protein [Romboutsia weinsteinii]
MKKKISSILAVSLIATNISPAINVFANEIDKEKVKLIEESVANQAKISPFNLNSHSNFEGYNKIYRVATNQIKSISNNGGQYSSNSIDKAIDGNLSTHWETGKQNTASFKNEVVVEFNQLESIDRIAYATRQDSAKGKGFPTEFEIYASTTGEDEDLKLMTTGSHTSTGNMLEFKFETITAKKIKFVFKEANQNWASASEFWFYREDKIIDKMSNIFTNDNKNELSEQFNTLEKLDAFDGEAQSHPLYSTIKEDIENARILLTQDEAHYMDAIVSKFVPFNDQRLNKYDELFKLSREEIKAISTNGGNYANNVIERAIDGDPSTQWHSGKTNSSTHTNEVTITLKELTEINRVMYTNKASRGFATEFEIYVSKTSTGDTFQKVTAGKHNVTSDTLEILFNPVQAKRIKFVFAKGHENWALAHEFGIYKQDTLKEIMDRLFVDSNMSEVNGQFATIGAIESLMEEAKEHPFKEEYMEKLELAKELVEFGQIQSGTSNVNKFTPFYTDYINQYDDTYRVKNISISNNGGKYGSSVIEKAIDEDVNSHWETGKPNSDSFKNEVVLTLKQAEAINRLTYKSRNGSKGFAKKFSIYVSPVASGDNFQKVSDGGYTITNDMMSIQFDNIKAKRVKFVFDEANQDWASIGDIRVYKEDKVSEKMETLFTNTGMSEVSEEFNSIEKLSALEEEVKNHPLAPVFLEDIDMAKEILSGTLQNIKTVVAEQVGDRNAHANSNLKFGYGNNYQPTGVMALAGETVTVYVDVEPGQPLPQLMFSQQEGSFASWGVHVSLHPGKNVIKVPKISQNDGWYKHSVTPGGPIYIVNPYTEEQQSKAPVIRFASGAELFPFLDKDTNEAELISFIKEYKKKLEEDKKQNPDVMDRKVLDLFEFASDRIVFTGTATGAYQAYVTGNKKPLSTLNMWDDHMDMLFKYQGLDGRSEKHDIKKTRENIRLAQPFGYMYAAGGHIGVQKDVMSGMLTSVGGWGVDHEIGHKMDIGVRTVGEVTNNMLPQHSSYYYNSPDKRIPFESHVFKNVIDTDNNEYNSGGFFEKLAVFWQLEMIYPGYWAKLNSLYRENNVVLDPNNASNDKLNQLAKYSSIALELDLTEHFERHGFWVSDETKEFLSKYQKPDKKTWYASYDYIEYKGDGLTENPKVDIGFYRMNTSLQLNLKVDSKYSKDIMGYEILKDGEVIGFTSTNSFIDVNSEPNESATYKVIPYDKKLNDMEGTEINSQSPGLRLQQDIINLKLRENFDPMALVNAVDYMGNDIDSKVEVTSNVNQNEKGEYEVTYSVTDRGITVSKTVKVNVVSDYDYLSDSEWKSVETQYGSPRRNSNIKGRVNGDITTFEKGFGIHAKGKIVYDLSDKDYDTFEALLGVDVGIASQEKSSITFKIVGDGKTLATTNVLKHADNMTHINVDVKGVQELVIEINDGGNGNSSDHAVIANPKLTTNNAKPVITANSKEYLLGSDINILDGVSALDTEDGDLTSSIEIVLNNYEENKSGRFEVVYKVTDSDNNSVEKKVYITVYENLNVDKSKYGKFDNLDKYNEEFKIPAVSVSNNAGNYGSSVIAKTIDNKINTHWETNKTNSETFKNEIIFDLGETKEISKIAYAARRDAGGKGFANKFEIYVSNESEGNDFILAGKGEYKGSNTDVVEFNISKTNARRVKFKFVEANQGWASLSEISFYKEDVLANKINDLFTDNTKTEVNEKYNTLESVDALKEEVKNHPAYKLFEEDLNKAKEIIEAKFPTLKVEEVTYIKLNNEFDLMSGVSASDKEDGNITSSVVVNSGEFTTSKAGEYTITYTVTDSDKNIATKERKIVVYSEDKHMSDINWESAVSGWRTVTKDTAVASNNKIKLNINGKIQEFAKGIGAATNAEIVYNLNGEYSNFSTYMGTDKNYNDNRTSIIFKVFADGKEVYTSDVIRKDSKAEFVSLDVTGVKELKLVANDAGDGGLGDYASWAEPKLYSTNVKPKLTIEKDIAVKLGDSIENVIGEFSATDAEDGDLTNKVEIAGQDKVNFNRAGKYKITFTVTDSDGNKIEKVRTISVVNMEDFKYLTDYDWKSANQSHGSTRKDSAASANALRLTKEDGTVATYERGIGAHSNATIVYDLSDKEYDFFSAYVGVDRAMHGTVGSVQFEVYVDNQKAFDSGVMNSRDAQKYVEVSIAGAKELKLVVKDGGNGIGSDHASFGDTKLHFANDVLDFTELESVIENAENINKENYTSTSIEALETALNKAKEVVSSADATQELIDEAAKDLKDALDNIIALDNFKELESLLEEANKLKIYMYTKDSRDILESSKAKVEEILSSKSQTVEEIKVAVEEFRNILNSLELDADKVAIQEKLEEIKDITRNDIVGDKHVEVRWSNFQIAKEDLEKLLVNTNATKQEISNAIFMMDYFLDDLIGDWYK